jgi:hypothetical protein
MNSDSPPTFLKQYDIFQLCLAFLSCKENLRHTIFMSRMEYRHPLLQYCALGWARHGIACGDSDPLFAQKVVSLFQDHQTAAIIANVLCDERIYYRRFHHPVSPLHIYACLGLRQLVMHLLPHPGRKVTKWSMHILPRLFRERSLINSIDHLQHTALSLAIQAGHSNLALYLIEHPKVDVNIPDLRGRCPLSYAAGTGNVAVVRALLKRGAKCDSRDRISRTPLAYAASEDAIEVVELLLRIPMTFDLH